MRVDLEVELELKLKLKIRGRRIKILKEKIFVEREDEKDLVDVDEGR